MNDAFDRRTFLSGAAAGAGALALSADPALAARKRIRRSRLELAREGEFLQGVASGQPGEHAITLWTKVANLDRRAKLQFEIARDPNFRRVVARRNVTADPANDFAVNARINHRALRAGEEYFYRFYTCFENSAVGKFRTARPADSREPVRIGFFSCQDFVAGFYTAHAGLAAEDLDLVVCLGDYIYERRFDDSGSDAPRQDRTGANGDGEVQTLEEYRAKYALYHADANLRATRQNHAMISIWDDHEVEDNYADGLPGGQTEERRIPYRERQQNGYRTFFEHMPRIRSRAESDRIYGKLSLGGTAELFLLDTRQYRDDQPCNPGDRGFQPCPENERNDPRRTLLGAEQKAWLKKGLASSRATWKVVANQIMIMALDVPARNPLNTDQWDGYEAERRELLEFARTNGVRDLTFMTGDIHTFFSGNVTPSGRQGLPQDGEPVATEFVGGSITSRGIIDQGDEREADAARPAADQQVYANNPHIRYSNQRFKGYGILEARGGELRVDYRAVRTTRGQRSEVFTLQRHRVQSGTPRVEVLDPEPAPQPLPQPS